MAGSSGFHAYKSVAPLKPTRTGQTRRAIDTFPRLQKRGPIEAYRHAARGALRVAFPRLQKRGPIEAIAIWMGKAQHAPVSTLTKAWPH